MPKPWKDVAASPEYQALPPDQQAAARDQYFSQVVAPQISDPAQVEAAKAQFDQQYGQQGQQSQPAKPAMPDPVKQTLFQRVNAFGNDLGDSFVHHLANIPIGAAQLVAHNLKDRADMLAPPEQGRTLSSLITGQQDDGNSLGDKARSIGRKEVGFVDNAVNRLDQWIAQREANYQKDVPDSAGSYTGAAIGEVLPWMTGMGGARAAGALPKAQGILARASRAAVEGGGMGSVQPVTDGDYARGKLAHIASGAIASPILHGALGLVAAPFANKVKVPRADRAAADVLLNQAESPQALTRAAPSQVPGVQRTLAEETLDPGVARLERNLRSTNKQFDALDRANNAARVGSLEKIAGSDADMAAALGARDTTTGALRDTAFQEGQGFDAANAAQQAADRSSHASIVRDIQKANERRRALGYATQLPVPEAPATSSPKEALQSRIGEVIAKNNGNPAVQTALSVVGGALRQAEDSVPGLYNVRKYVGDLLSGRAGGDTVSAKAASRELIDIRDSIDEELKRRAPSFSKYLTAYQDASKPINRMQVGRDFLKASSGSAIKDPVTGMQVLTPAQFSKKARDLDTVAARATGFAKAKASDILAPNDIAAIKAIQDDLERQAFRATAGSGGNSQTFERQAMQDKITRGVGRGVLHHIPVVGRYAGDFLDMLDRSRNDHVKERLAYLVANPAEARRVLSSLSTPQKQVLSDALEALGSPVSRIAVQPFGNKPEGQ